MTERTLREGHVSFSFTVYQPFNFPTVCAYKSGRIYNLTNHMTMTMRTRTGRS